MELLNIEDVPLAIVLLVYLTENSNIGKSRQIQEFKNDFYCERFGLINLCLDGGFIDFAYDGEEYH